MHSLSKVDYWKSLLSLTHSAFFLTVPTHAHSRPPFSQHWVLVTNNDSLFCLIIIFYHKKTKFYQTKSLKTEKKSAENEKFTINSDFFSKIDELVLFCVFWVFAKIDEIVLYEIVLYDCNWDFLILIFFNLLFFWLSSSLRFFGISNFLNS